MGRRTGPLKKKQRGGEKRGSKHARPEKTRKEQARKEEQSHKQQHAGGTIAGSGRTGVFQGLSKGTSNQGQTMGRQKKAKKSEGEPARFKRESTVSPDETVQKKTKSVSTPASKTLVRKRKRKKEILLGEGGQEGKGITPSHGMSLAQS